MTLRTSAFRNDELTLTWWDLFRLALGWTLHTGSLTVMKEEQR